jgi:hypothetical protein
METIQVSNELNKEWGLTLAPDTSREYMLQALTNRINELILHDFAYLVQVLYRLDVNENLLKQWLRENSDTDAGKIIAALVVERIIQKIKSRQENSRDDVNISEEERW